MEMILHIAPKDTWEAALKDGLYWSDTLDTEGFIHCSTSEQIVEVANRFYHDLSDLVLLVIDADSVNAPICYQAPAENPSSIQRFPHIFGPLNIDAVLWVTPLVPETCNMFAVS